MIEEVLLALATPLAKLIETILADNYDADAELQAVLALQRAASDARAARALPPA